MSFLDRLPWRRKSATSLDILRELFGGESKTGLTVNWKTALEVTTVLACVRVIADGVAQVPWKVYRETGPGNREPAIDNALFRLLARKPNDWQTSVDFRRTLVLHRALTGQAFIFVSRVRGRIVELIPLEPGRVTVKRDGDLTLSYEVTGEHGERRIFPAGTIWHLKGFSWNSWMGLEPVRLAREAIGLGLATEEQAARMHKNGMRPSGVISVDRDLNDESYKRLRAWIDAHYTGVAATGRPLILGNAAKWLPQALTAAEAQHLETRKFQVEEICRAFGVMPIMVGYSDKTATYASAEQMFLAHVVHTLGPWYAEIEQSADAFLLTDDEAEGGLYTKFVANGLMRGAAKDRAAFYGAGIKDGWLTRNEARALEDLNPLEGLDEPLRPLNMGRGSEPPPEDAVDGGTAKSGGPFDIETKGLVYVRDHLGRFSKVPGASDGRVDAWVTALVNRRRPGHPKRHFRHTVRQVAEVDDGVMKAALADGLAPSGRKIMLTSRNIDHMTRPSKGGKNLPTAMVARMPSLLRSPVAVLRGVGDDSGLYYVSRVPGESRLARIYVKLGAQVRVPARRGQKRRTATANVIWSASLVPAENLRSGTHYKVITGKI
jgi:HK97 family phage portal protein